MFDHSSSSASFDKSTDALIIISYDCVLGIRVLASGICLCMFCQFFIYLLMSLEEISLF